MTSDIVLVLLIALGAVVLFVSGRLRVDLVALLVLATLVIAGLVSPEDALAGFSNPAVITVWAVFILSGGLSRTGIANILGNQVLRAAGNNRLRLLFLIMFTAAILSAFMNNVGVAALLLPVVIEIAKKTKSPPSKLLMPLATGALLGGMTTLIGTPPNILASDALRDAGLQPFRFFDFTPIGAAVMIVGLLFIVLIGNRLLPNRDPVAEVRANKPQTLEDLYRLQDQFLILRIPSHSTLSGMSLAQSQLGSMLGLNVIAVIRNGRTRLSPSPAYTLRTGDRLVVVGDTKQLAELRNHQVDTIQRSFLSIDQIRNAGMDIAELTFHPNAAELSRSLKETDFRRKHGLNVLAIMRGEKRIYDHVQSVELESSDRLLIQGPKNQLEEINRLDFYELNAADPTEIAELNIRLLLVCIPPDSTLVRKELKEANLGEAFGLTVLRIARGDEAIILPDPSEEIHGNDTLLVQGSDEDVAAIRGLEGLEIDSSSLDLDRLESTEVGLVEAVLSPHTRLAGKTLTELKFRDKYGLNVLAILRKGEIYRHDLGDIALRFGDSLLLHGARDKIILFGSEPDFIVLREAAQEPPNLAKAPLAILIMIAVLISVLVGWLPIAIAAVIGATVMVLANCLTMEEAYRSIDWPAVFLIAAMLPLGIAMEQSGTTQFLTNQMLAIIGESGPVAVLAGLFLLSVLSSQVIPNAAVVVLMAPIAISTAAVMDVSPQSFMMGIAIAASASFLSPVSHPANVLVMGPGGYKFADYIRVGLPLTIIVFFVALLLLPIVWPF
jgi:di/tricarboxylate transporter